MSDQLMFLSAVALKSIFGDVTSSSWFGVINSICLEIYSFMIAFGSKLHNLMYRFRSQTVFVVNRIAKDNTWINHAYQTGMSKLKDMEKSPIITELQNNLPEISMKPSRFIDKLKLLLQQYNLQGFAIFFSLSLIIFCLFLFVDTDNSNSGKAMEAETTNEEKLIYSNDKEGVPNKIPSCAIIIPNSDGPAKSMDHIGKKEILTEKRATSKELSILPLTSVTLSKFATDNPSSQNTMETHLSTPPRARGKYVYSDLVHSGGERENDMARFTNLTGVSTLTPDSGFREIAWKMELMDEDESGSDQYEQSSSWTDNLHQERGNSSSVLQRSVKDPSVLLSWRIYVDKYGLGTIVGIKRKKFSTTKFEIQFDNGQLHKLALKRSSTKGNVPFNLIKKIG